MNDVLRQLLAVAPGLTAGFAGNGEGSNAFMEGFQRAQRELDERDRLKQRDSLHMQDRDLALQDRQRAIERQKTADESAAEDRAQQQAIRSFQIPAHLAELGSVADDPQGAQALIEGAMPNVMKAFGQESMAYGMPAIELATRTITGRQKKQVEAYVEAALKTSFVADNPEADPELVNLPDHIQRVIGRPTAKLSELQTFAQLPIGKPASKTRTPAAVGSFEDYVESAYGANPTPEQILEARKLYNQSDDRPRITVNTGGGAYPPQTQRRIDAIVRGFDSQPIVKKTQTMAEAVTFADSLDINTTNPADDQAMIYAFAKAMDPESVVREGEYATVQKYAQSWAERFGFDVQRIFSNTQFLTPEARRNMKATIRAKFEAGRGQYDNLRREYGRKIERITMKTGGVDELTDFGAAFPADVNASGAPGSGPALPPMAPVSSRGPMRLPGAQPATAGSDGRMPAAQPRERRKFGEELREWNGSRWVLVTPQ